MEVSQANIAVFGDYLQKSMSHDAQIRKPAEEFLRSVETNQNFPLLVLTLLDRDGDVVVKTAGAIHFKNYVKRNWKINDDDIDRIHPDDRTAVKKLIVDVMLKSSPSIQKQLSESISIIGDADFPAKWPNLLGDMVTKFAAGDFNVINGVLQTASSIFEKYSYEMKSQKLWEEIKFVLDNFAKPFTDLCDATMKLAETHAANPQNLRVIFGSLVLIAKIFYYLNYQDLPEFFEDHMASWMSHFHTLLTIDNKLLRSENDSNDEPGLLQELKSQICDNIGLYAHKYEEEFSPYMNQFVTAVWNLLLSTTGPHVKDDLLVSNAIQFLASVADRTKYKSIFQESSVLASICEKIVIPNMELRLVDVEMFEDNPEEFIRRDLEGSDIDTRRRAACDLVRALSKHFEAEITVIFGRYIQNMLESYMSDPLSKWLNKDAATYLVTTLATRAKTAKHGITQTNNLVDLHEFFNKHMLPELERQPSSTLNAAVDIIRSDAVKYLMTFRSQLPVATIKNSFPILVRMLSSGSRSYVLITYTAAAVDKLLLMKSSCVQFEGDANQNGLDAIHQTAIIGQAELAPVAEQLLNGLFTSFELTGSAENEYVMKAIMRTFSALRENLIPYLSYLMPVLTQKLQNAAKNPTRPHYNHYLFESISLAIRIVCGSQPGAVSNFELVLFPVFQSILQQDVQEFVPYVFQILSLLLELHKVVGTNEIPQTYLELFSFLLDPILWDRPGNITPLVRLLQAYVAQAAPQIMGLNKLEGLLGIFQKLIASKSNDHEGFYLLQSIVEYFPPEVVSKYINQVMMLLFQRLTSSKTTKFVKNFLVFIFLYIVKFGGSEFISIVDSIQNNMFTMICQRLIFPEVQKVSGSTEKKIVAVGLTLLLCQTPMLVSNGIYVNHWPGLLQSVIGIIELPPDTSIPEDEHFVEIEDTPGYSATNNAYSHLIFGGGSKSRSPDPVGHISDVRINLVQGLQSLAADGRISSFQPLLAQMDVGAQQHLTNYLHVAQVSLP